MTRRLARGLWLLVTVAVGISFVGRPLAMKGGVLAAEEAARHGSSSMPDARTAGAADAPMPCPHHSGQCCAPCLACCACIVAAPLPRTSGTLEPAVAAVRLVRAAPAPDRPSRAGERHLQPLPLGPPLPLVG